MIMDTPDLLHRFFKGIGAEREAQMYLGLFKKGKPERFAIVEIEDGLSKFSINLLAMHLAFLSNLGLYPVVVHGHGDAKRKKLISRKSIEALGEALQSAIILHGGSAEIVSSPSITEGAEKKPAVNPIFIDRLIVKKRFRLWPRFGTSRSR